MTSRWFLAACALPCALIGHLEPAHACGGCFHAETPVATASVVTGHRMAVSISNERTVLWDQIEYSGDPEDFAWVLPVGPGAVLEASNDAWFESLDAVTNTRVVSQTLTCSDGSTVMQAEGSSGGCAGGTERPLAADGRASPGAEVPMRDGADEGVTVTHEATVGPYETVTLHAEDAQALKTWLTTHGYAIPGDIEPVIDSYIEEGADFIALRLAPGQGTRQMTPVRVVTPGGGAILPLRMVAAGTGASVSLVLYVIGEGRYGADGFPEAIVHDANLTWNWDDASSNYATERDQALVSGGWLTTYARAEAFFSAQVAPTGVQVSWSVAGESLPYRSLAPLYYAQAASNDEMPDDCGPTVVAVQNATEVVASCDDTEDGCGSPPQGALREDEVACNGYDDLAAALVGMHPRDVWVTRLEANLPRAALDRDLRLAAREGTPVDNWRVAQKNEGSPCNGQPVSDASDEFSSAESGCGCRIRPTAPRTMASTTAVLALLLVLRRHRGRRGRAATSGTPR
jgi:hypothetical protein